MTDSADWTQTVTVTDISGTPTSVGPAVAQIAAFSNISSGLANGTQACLFAPLGTTRTIYAVSLWAVLSNYQPVAAGGTFVLAFIQDVHNGNVLCQANIAVPAASAGPPTAINQSDVSFPGGVLTSAASGGTAVLEFVWDNFGGTAAGWTITLYTTIVCN